jgi:hypothetical protein
MNMNKTQFKAGDRVRVVGPGVGNSVEVGDTGTVVRMDFNAVGVFADVHWDKGGQWSVFAHRLEYEAPYTFTRAPAEVHAALDELWAAKQAHAAALDALTKAEQAAKDSSTAYTAAVSTYGDKRRALDVLVQ